MPKITPYKIKKAFLYLKHFGPREFMNHLFERLEPEDVPYDGWFRTPSKEELEKQRKAKIKEGPLFSLVVPAYCTKERFFREMIDSVIGQTYENWELCIADASDREPVSGERSVGEIVRDYDDDRIRYKKLEKNEGIAQNSNAAMAMAHGDYIALIDS